MLCVLYFFALSESSLIAETKQDINTLRDIICRSVADIIDSSLSEFPHLSFLSST